MKVTRWKLHDPAEAIELNTKQRWTSTHVVADHDDTRTLCGRLVPAHPYMQDWLNVSTREQDDLCKACTRKLARAGHDVLVERQVTSAWSVIGVVLVDGVVIERSVIADDCETEADARIIARDALGDIAEAAERAAGWDSQP